MWFKTGLVGILSVSLVVALTNQIAPHLELRFEVLHGDDFESSSPHKSAQIVKRSDGRFTFINKETFYVSSVQVGASKEPNKILIDTNSPDVWFMGKNVVCEYQSRRKNLPKHPHLSSHHTSEMNLCHILGSVNPAISNTFQSNKSDPDFYIRYPGNDYASGIWGTDMVGFSNSEFAITFGVANKTSSFTGRLGLGPFSGEEIKTRPYNGQSYTSFPMSLKKAGRIKKAVYSICFDKQKPPIGIIQFGVVDHKKYMSSLQTVRMVNLHKDFIRLDVPAIRLNQMYVEGGLDKVVVMNQSIGAVLDTKSTAQFLPSETMRALAETLQGKYLADSGIYEVECSYRKSKKLVYDFSGHLIKIPLGDIVVKRNGVCYLAAKSSSGKSYFKTARLGTSFLQNVYTVYDIDSMEISLAQANYSEEKQLETVVSTVPGAKRAARYSQTALTVDLGAMHKGLFSSGFENL